MTWIFGFSEPSQGVLIFSKYYKDENKFSCPKFMSALDCSYNTLIYNIWTMPTNNNNNNLMHIKLKTK